MREFAPLLIAGEVALLLWSPQMVKGKEYPQLNKLSNALNVKGYAEPHNFKSTDFLNESQFYKACLKSNSEKAEPKKKRIQNGHA